MKNNLLLLSIFCACLSIDAQNVSKLRIGFEMGGSAMMGEMNDRWEFRKPWNRYSDYDSYYYGSDNAEGEGNMFYARLKMELPLLKDWVTLSSGLRYTHFNERIFTHSDSHLYLFHPSQQGIELFRINDINESLGYLSVPLEADVAIFGKIRRWHVFVKGGIQAGIKVHDKSRISFVSKEMEKYESEILVATGGSPSNFMSSIYGSVGFRFIFDNQLRITIENSLPHLFLTKNNFSLITPEGIPGLQASVTVPLNFFSHN